MEGSNKTPYELNNKNDTTRHLRAMEASSNKTPYESGNNELHREIFLLLLARMARAHHHSLFIMLRIELEYVEPTWSGSSTTSW